MEKKARIKHHREKIAVDDELTYTGRNGVTYHMQLVKKLQDPLVKFICAWYGFAIVKWDDCSIQFGLATKKSFEEAVQLGVSESGELKRRYLDSVNFPTSCIESLWLPDAMKSLQGYERALVKLFSEASCFLINPGGHYVKNIFHGCMNVEMAKLKLGLMPEIEKPKIFT